MNTFPIRYIQLDVMQPTRESSTPIRFALAAFFGLLFSTFNSHGQPSTARDSSVFGVFVGSTLVGELLAQRLNIPTNIEPPLRWQLTLHQDAKSQSPTSYKLRCDYALSANASDKSHVEKSGTWKQAKGTKFNPNATVLELDGLVSLFKVDWNLLHVLNADGGLMMGDGGYSFTLNRTTAAEQPQPPPPAGTPSISYRIAPPATGPTVFGVFEGRTPCLGIARELNRTLDAHRMKAKWRVTLLQNPETKAPTIYKVEGSFYRGDLREGNWSIVRGPETDPTTIIYRLEPASGEPALLLVKGDDNVLFFADQKGRPLVGHADFSYTLNRKSIPVEAAASTAASR